VTVSVSACVITRDDESQIRRCRVFLEFAKLWELEHMARGQGA
jgi:hypothetical protein